MATSPAFQFYPGDFVTGTIHMTAEEIGGYMLMLCTQWEQGSLPSDTASLRRIARCSTRALQTILEKFSEGEDGRLRNHRMELVREEREEFRRQQGAKAKKRWKGCHGNATAMPRHDSGICQNDALQSSSSSSSSINPNTAAAPLDGGSVRAWKPTRSQIESLYVAYPRRVGKGDAIKAIGKAIDRLTKEGKDALAFLLDRVMAYARSPAGQPPPTAGNDYRPHPARWFNDERYHDDESQWSKPNGINGSAAVNSPGRVDAPPGKYAHLTNQDHAVVTSATDERGANNADIF